jgi:hypothetical protein
MRTFAQSGGSSQFALPMKTVIAAEVKDPEKRFLNLGWGVGKEG